MALSGIVCTFAVVAFLFRLAGIVIDGSREANRASDLVVYLDAADHLRMGMSIYQTEIDIPRHGWPYVYPPLLAQAFIPFASYSSAWSLLTMISLVGWLGSLGAILWALRASVLSSTRRELRPVMLAGLVLWPAVLFDVLAGQVQLPLLALLTASWLALGHGHERTAGVLLGVAIAIKPLPAAALLILLAARQWRASITAVVVAALLLLTSFGLAGWDQALTYVFSSSPRLRPFHVRQPQQSGPGDDCAALWTRAA